MSLIEGIDFKVFTDKFLDQLEERVSDQATILIDNINYIREQKAKAKAHLLDHQTIFSFFATDRFEISPKAEALTSEFPDMFLAMAHLDLAKLIHEEKERRKTD